MASEIYETRPQKLGEEIANSISHGTGALLAIAGTVLLIVRSALVTQSPLAVVSCALYGASLILLYTFSCLYHSLTVPVGKRVFQVFDHCSIFLLILGTYIPISLLLIGGKLGWTLFGISTSCAVLGIVLNSINLRKWRKVSMFLYVIMGWMLVFAIKPVISVVPLEGILLLFGGGVAYTLGIIFYKAKNVRYMHFVWHIFVLAGSVLHFFLIYLYCL